MLKFAANLSFLFPSLSFPDRFSAAAQAGFKGCEFLFPYEHAPNEISRLLKTSGLTQVLFNLPPGDWKGGERGIAALTGREAEFRSSVETALAYAEATGCQRLHIMGGVQTRKTVPHGRSFWKTLDTPHRDLARIIHQPNPISSGREGLAVLTGMT